MYSFNLVDQGWLPCVMSDGSFRELNLREIFSEAHNIRELIGDSPPETIALHRILLAMIHRILLGPKSAAEWGELKAATKFDSAQFNEYLDKWQSRFDLFDEKYPFYQSAASKENVQTGAIIQLYYQGKNNATLFDHTSTDLPKQVSPSEAARMLVAFQGFDFGGIKSDGSAQKAVLLNAAVALFRGATLFQTLLLNLHRYNENDDAPFALDYDKDLPAWERGNAIVAGTRQPDGYVDLLTWQSRRLYIQPELDAEGNVFVRNSVVMLGYAFPPNADLHQKETMIAFRASKTEGYFAVGFSESRALWRNSLSLLQTVSGENFKPKMLNWLSDLVEMDEIAADTVFSVDFYGMAADKAKLLFWNHESFDLPAEFLSDQEILNSLSLCLDVSETIGFAVRSGVKTLADELESSPTSFQTMNAYWPQLEGEFNALLLALPNDPDRAKSDWFGKVLNIAERALKQTFDSLSHSAIEQKAMVEAENEYRKQKAIAIKKNLSMWEKYLPKNFAKGGTK